MCYRVCFCSVTIRKDVSVLFGFGFYPKCFAAPDPNAQVSISCRRWMDRASSSLCALKSYQLLHNKDSTATDGMCDVRVTISTT